MIRALVFDWGNVLMRTIDVRPRSAWERRLGLPPEGLPRRFFGSQAWDRAQRGELSLDDVWEEVAEFLGVDSQALVALKRDFWAGDRLDERLLDLIGELREKGLRTALLSNHPANLPPLLNDLGLESLFDTVTISALEGVAKPDPAIYQRTLERLGVDAAEAVFVDDYGANVEAARSVGMAAIQFRGVLHLRRSLSAMGLPVQFSLPEPIAGVGALVFDWGGVLCPLSFHKNTHEWEKRLDLPQGAIPRALWGEEWKSLEIGAISSETYDDHVAQQLGLPDRKAVRRFYDQYYADDNLELPVVDAVRSLRERYPVALLTNAFPGHAEMACERYGFDPRAEFDLYVNSAEVGMAKPDPAIYRLVLDRLEVSPQRAIFVDDSVRNTDGARLLGIQTLVFTDTQSALENLAALLGHPISSAQGA